jgi:hypothetical protein
MGKPLPTKSGNLQGRGKLCEGVKSALPKPHGLARTLVRLTAVASATPRASSPSSGGKPIRFRHHPIAFDLMGCFPSQVGRLDHAEPVSCLPAVGSCEGEELVVVEHPPGLILLLHPSNSGLNRKWSVEQKLRGLGDQRWRRSRRKGGNTGEEFIEKRRPSKARFLYLFF